MHQPWCSERLPFLALKHHEVVIQRQKVKQIEIITSTDWFEENFAGNPHIQWENLWFPADVPFNQSVDHHHLHLVAMGAHFNGRTFFCRRLAISNSFVADRFIITLTMIFATNSCHKTVNCLFYNKQNNDIQDFVLTYMNYESKIAAVPWLWELPKRVLMNSLWNSTSLGARSTASTSWKLRPGSWGDPQSLDGFC